MNSFTHKKSISPGQGLLILIEEYRNDQITREKLKKLYFLGVNPQKKISENIALIDDEIQTHSIQEMNDFDSVGMIENEEGEDGFNANFSDILESFDIEEHFLGKNSLGIDDKPALEKLFLHPALKEYEIDYSPESIDKDASRRYFETHLAYESIKSNIPKVQLADLQLHEQALMNTGNMKHSVSSIKNILLGNFNKSDIKLYEEYANYINKLNHAEIFQDLSQDARMNILYFVKISCLGVLGSTVNDDLPLDIYGTGIYSASSRGKSDLRDHKTIRNNVHMGLMKSTMPTPRDGIAYTESKLPSVKASDTSTYDIEAEWVKDNFDRLVHPFSNSISGTMLAQLRNMLAFKKENSSPFLKSADEMKLFLALFISILLYNAGGHSLHEFTAVLSLPEVQEEFKSIPEFNSINLESLFYTNNQVAFNKALDDTIAYNTIILQQARVHESLILHENKTDPEARKNAIQALEERNELRKLVNVIQEHIESEKKISAFSSFSPQTKELLNKKLELIKHSIIDGNLKAAKSSFNELSKLVNVNFEKSKTLGYSNKSPLFRILEPLNTKLNDILTSKNDQSLVKPNHKPIYKP